MNFQIEFEDSPIGIIHPSKVRSISFICSIFKVYSMASIELKDFAKDSFNLIKSGLPVNLTFLKKNGEPVIHKMKLLSFFKTPAPQTVYSDTLQITLISSIYYDNSFGTSVHEGSVGVIYDQIMKRFFSNTVSTYKGTITDDVPRRRYQTSERTLDFMKRIMKYAVKDNKPVYLFYDNKGILNFKGVSDMTNEVPHTALITIWGSTSPRLKKDFPSDRILTMLNFSSTFDGRTAPSSISNIFTTTNFRFSNKTPKGYKYTTINSSNNQVHDPVPPKVKYYGWNLSPTDAYAIAARDSYEETYNNCSFKATFMNVDSDELTLGTTVDIFLPYEKSALNSKNQDANLGEGRYLVTDIEYSLNDDGFYTIATLTQVVC